MKRLAIFLLTLSLLMGAGLAQAQTMVNVNEADAAALAAALTGVGQARAEAIISYREANGPFQSVHELLQVPGIGPATVELNLDRIQLGNEE
ncbi:competence protein ComEA [Ectothiorhodosinus mongolicus]|uniref:Competence protein ComEA n=1 Tax=Ectothiorhodosinus mongolicus TaxID=233100 RepID=A0A1R3VR39_9GAMM|nr:helix-hairpin-helix domain-containing protein [Ectothiorhodosinus mongolicus]ULX57734.1 competence protein ComEA [Ectothiorhodosinus mongolicus]SIT65592.1 competence protein ComEA [Ectothiorhodosinus mongolicus]